MSAEGMARALGGAIRGHGNGWWKSEVSSRTPTPRRSLGLNDNPDGTVSWGNAMRAAANDGH